MGLVLGNDSRASERQGQFKPRLSEFPGELVKSQIPGPQLLTWRTTELIKTCMPGRHLVSPRKK